MPLESSVSTAPLSETVQAGHFRNFIARFQCRKTTIPFGSSGGGNEEGKVRPAERAGDNTQINGHMAYARKTNTRGRGGDAKLLKCIAVGQKTENRHAYHSNETKQNTPRQKHAPKT